MRIFLLPLLRMGCRSSPPVGGGSARGLAAHVLIHGAAFILAGKSGTREPLRTLASRLAGQASVGRYGHHPLGGYRSGLASGRDVVAGLTFAYMYQATN